jgi:hypothetical protein
MSRTGTTNRSGRDGPDERKCGKSGDRAPVGPGCMRANVPDTLANPGTNSFRS